MTGSLKRSYVNVRIGLSGEVFRIDKRDMPFVRRLLLQVSTFGDNSS